jgi:hypothetical protein
MPKLERAPRLAIAGAHRRERPPLRQVADSADADLLDQLLPPIERRRRAAHRRLEALARRRVAMSAFERALEGEPLRAEVVQIRAELARLNLVASLTSRILRPLPVRGQPGAAAPPSRNPLSDPLV